LKLKLQTVAEKTAKNFRGLLYFAAPGISIIAPSTQTYNDRYLNIHVCHTQQVTYFTSILISSTAMIFYQETLNKQ